MGGTLLPYNLMIQEEILWMATSVLHIYIYVWHEAKRISKMVYAFKDCIPFIQWEMGWKKKNSKGIYYKYGTVRVVNTSYALFVLI